jgi:hypothetical protein
MGSPALHIRVPVASRPLHAASVKCPSGSSRAVRSTAPPTAYGAAGWALCAATMTVLLQLCGLAAAIIVHAVAAPAFFLALGRRYFGVRGARDPLPTATASNCVCFRSGGSVADMAPQPLGCRGRTLCRTPPSAPRPSLNRRSRPATQQIPTPRRYTGMAESKPQGPALALIAGGRSGAGDSMAALDDDDLMRLVSQDHARAFRAAFLYAVARHRCDDARGRDRGRGRGAAPRITVPADRVRARAGRWGDRGVGALLSPTHRGRNTTRRRRRCARMHGTCGA